MATATQKTKAVGTHQSGAAHHGSASNEAGGHSGGETFQSVVHGGIEAEGEAVSELLGGVLHQLRGADGGDDGEMSPDNTGYLDNASDVGADNTSDVGADEGSGYEEEGANEGYEPSEARGESSGVMADILSSLNLDKGADDEPSVVIIEGSGSDDSSDAGGGSGSGGGSDGGSPSSSSSPSTSKHKQGHHGTHARKKVHHAEGDDGYEPFPSPTEGPSPVPLVSPEESGYTPTSEGTGVNLGDILTAVGETANATAAVAGAVAASNEHPIEAPIRAPLIPVAPPQAPWFSEEGEGGDEMGLHHQMHGHAKRFAHERPVLFLLALGAALYFIFFKQDSLFETVLHTGTKSRKHDKVETFTEEVHTKREAVIGKPVFPGQSTAS